jgi:hypothetical protein
VKAWLMDQDESAQTEFAAKFSDRPPLPPEVEASLQEKTTKKKKRDEDGNEIEGSADGSADAVATDTVSDADVAADAEEAPAE